MGAPACGAVAALPGDGDPTGVVGAADDGVGVAGGVPLRAAATGAATAGTAELAAGGTGDGATETLGDPTVTSVEGSAGVVTVGDGVALADAGGVADLSVAASFALGGVSGSPGSVTV